MTQAAVLSSHWDQRRQATTHKITIPGTSRFLLFTDETLLDLERQITAALKASNACGT